MIGLGQKDRRREEMRLQNPSVATSVCNILLGAFESEGNLSIIPTDFSKGGL